MTTKYVYHIYRDCMQGDTLYPLNQLKIKYPDIYKIHAEKYKGREYLLDNIIPFKNCLWNDVLHFSPIPIDKIIYEIEKIKSKNPILPTFKVFYLPVSEIKNLGGFYFYPIKGQDLKKGFRIDQFEKFNENKLQTMQYISEDQYKDWQNYISEGKQVLYFTLTPHILIPNSIKLSLGEIREFNK